MKTLDWLFFVSLEYILETPVMGRQNTLKLTWRHRNAEYYMKYGSSLTLVIYVLWL